MISGLVTDRYATVALTFLQPFGSSIPIEFVIDTGFTGELCLPLEAVSLMGLTFRHDIPANLADNSEVLLPIYEAIVLWNGEEREVLVIATPKASFTWNCPARRARTCHSVYRRRVGDN